MATHFKWFPTERCEREFPRQPLLQPRSTVRQISSVSKSTCELCQQPFILRSNGTPGECGKCRKDVGKKDESRVDRAVQCYRQLTVKQRREFMSKI